MTSDFHAAVLDALSPHVAVLDSEGRIVYVNRAWTEFSQANGGPGGTAWLGQSYLAVCGDTVSSDPWPGLALDGIRSVQSGLRREYSLEYPCHSPTEQRWFQMRVRTLQTEGGPRYCVVTHDNVTERVLAEMRLAELDDTDAVTRLPNWRRFEQHWVVEWGRGLRLKRPLLLFRFMPAQWPADADTGSVNRALRQLATALRTQARRPGDLAARATGGDCLLLLAGAGAEAVPGVLAAVSESLSTAAARTQTPVPPARWRVASVSCEPQPQRDAVRELHAMLAKLGSESGDAPVCELPASVPLLTAMAL